MITVYHVDFDTTEKLDPTMDLYYKLTYRPTPEMIAAAIVQECYKKVAVVNTNHLDSAYELTNHIDTSWDQNFGVTPVKLGNRSTSIGDLMITDSDLYVVDRMGFTKLPTELKESLTRPITVNSENVKTTTPNRYKF